MSALGGGTSLTVAMAFLCIFFGSISLLFFILRLRQKKAEFKDETEKFYPNFLHLFVAIFLCDFFKKIMRYFSKYVRLTLHLLK